MQLRYAGRIRLTTALAAVALGVTIGLVAGACSISNRGGDAGVDVKPRAVATVAPLADIVRQVAGEDAELIQVIPAGVDSHTFEPSPATARSLASADLVFLNGLGLDDAIARLVRANDTGRPKMVSLGERTITPDAYAFDFSFPRAGGSPNPHVWMNPVFALRYAEIVRDELSARSPERAGRYDANFSRFTAQIAELDAMAFASIQTIPAENRKLLTYHDSFAYFAPRYGMTVIGAIQLSSFHDPSPRDVAELISQVRNERVPAIFGSEVFPSPVLAQIAREGGARYVDRLRDDELPGREGSPQHSYIGMIREDVATIADALGGRVDAGRTEPN